MRVLCHFELNHFTHWLYQPRYQNCLHPFRLLPGDLIPILGDLAHGHVVMTFFFFVYFVRRYMLLTVDGHFLVCRGQ